MQWFRFSPLIAVWSLLDQWTSVLRSIVDVHNQYLLPVHHSNDCNKWAESMNLWPLKNKLTSFLISAQLCVKEKAAVKIKSNISDIPRYNTKCWNITASSPTFATIIHHVLELWYVYIFSKLQNGTELRVYFKTGNDRKKVYTKIYKYMDFSRHQLHTMEKKSHHWNSNMTLVDTACQMTVL